MTIGRSNSEQGKNRAIQALAQVAKKNRSFRHPREVLTRAIYEGEKRAILASWASDLLAVESRPTLRDPPGFDDPTCCTEMLDALKALDGLEWTTTFAHQALRGTSSRRTSPTYRAG